MWSQVTGCSVAVFRGINITLKDYLNWTCLVFGNLEYRLVKRKKHSSGLEQIAQKLKKMTNIYYLLGLGTSCNSKICVDKGRTSLFHQNNLVQLSRYIASSQSFVDWHWSKSSGNKIDCRGAAGLRRTNANRIIAASLQPALAGNILIWHTQRRT